MHVTLNDLEALPEVVKIGGLAINRDVYIDDQRLDIEPSLKVKQISPTFDWGYKGTGPGQLALAILYHFLKIHDGKIVEGLQVLEERMGSDLSLFLYEAFKITFVAQLPQSNFHVEVRLREFVIALAALNDKPIAAKDLVTTLPVDLGQNTVKAFGSLATNMGRGQAGDYVVAGEVPKKVSIAETGENSYDLQ